MLRLPETCDRRSRPGREPSMTSVDESDARQETVVVCRPADQATGLIEQLQQIGLRVLSFPLLEVVEPLDGGAALRTAVEQLDRYSMVAFTSANAVAAVQRSLGGNSWPPVTSTAAVGRATAAAVVEAGFPGPFVPTTATAAELGAKVPLPSDCAARPILGPLAELASPDLEVSIAERGGRFERVTAYRTTPVRYGPADVRTVARADYIVVTSPSIARELATIVGSARKQQSSPTPTPGVVAIGPRTADAASAAGLTVLSVAEPHDDGGLVSAIDALANG